MKETINHIVVKQNKLERGVIYDFEFKKAGLMPYHFLVAELMGSLSPYFTPIESVKKLFSGDKRPNQRQIKRAQAIIARAHKAGFLTICPINQDYEQLLLCPSDASLPTVLFVKGNFRLFEKDFKRYYVSPDTNKVNTIEELKQEPFTLVYEIKEEKQILEYIQELEQTPAGEIVIFCFEEIDDLEKNTDKFKEIEKRDGLIIAVYTPDELYHKDYLLGFIIHHFLNDEYFEEKDEIQQDTFNFDLWNTDRDGVAFNEEETLLVKAPKDIIVSDVPLDVKGINHYAFDGCKYLDSITLPDTLLVIGKAAFRDCSSLVEVILPYSLKRIDNEVFKGCVKLESVGFEEISDYCDCDESSIKAIPDSFCENCVSLDSIDFPSQLISIGTRAFKSCGLLRFIQLPDSLRIIQREAFYGCTNLQTILFPENIENIEADAFTGCNSLPSATILNCKKFEVQDNFIIFQKRLIGLCALTEQKQIIIPSGVTDVDTYVWRRIPQLEEIHLPNSINHIDLKYFKDCRWLKCIVVGNPNIELVGESKHLMDLTKLLVYEI